MTDISNLILSRASDAATDLPYNYVPTKYVAIIMLVLFSISAALHTAQALYFRMWWLLPTACLCGIAEILGWSARLWSSFSPTLSIPFQIQISTTIIAPTPLVAANFIILGRLIARAGPQYSRLSPKWYTIIFCSCDIIALVIQGVGGGLAASAETTSAAANGAHIMLGGIVFQLGKLSPTAANSQLTQPTAAIIVYALLATEFFLRYIYDAPFKQAEITPFSHSTTELGKSLKVRERMTQKLWWMSGALAFSTLVLFIRAVYRTIELSDGWHGRIIATQVYFNVLDGTMVILAMYILNILHPGLLLTGTSKSEASSESTRNADIPVQTSGFKKF